MHLYTYVYSYETSMCVCIVLHIYNCIYTAIYIITHFLLTICFVNIFSWLLYVFFMAYEFSQLLCNPLLNTCRL